MDICSCTGPNCPHEQKAEDRKPPTPEKDDKK